MTKTAHLLGKIDASSLSTSHRENSISTCRVGQLDVSRLNLQHVASPNAPFFVRFFVKKFRTSSNTLMKRKVRISSLKISQEITSSTEMS